MQTNQTSLPNWILIVSGLFALLELLVSIALFVSPESMLETVDLNASGVAYLINMWATRQLALGIIFGFATIKKSIPMLTCSYLFLLIVLLGDLYLGISKNEMPLILSAFIMTGVVGTVLYMLNKK